MLKKVRRIEKTVNQLHCKRNSKLREQNVASLVSNPKLADLNLDRVLEKCSQLPIKVNTSLFDVDTLRRIDKTPLEFLVDLVQCLNDYGIKDKYLADTLKTHEDWSQLTRSRLAQTSELFRSLSFKPSIYIPIISRHPNIMTFTYHLLTLRVRELRFFFSNAHLERLLPRSPHILTCDTLNAFRYKFNYGFTLMGFDQREMCSTHFFNYELSYIRARHLFLERAAFYEKPNKKGITRFENPKLAHIVDTNLKEYLRLCTHDLLTLDDFRTFCDYLEQEKFDNELLVSRIDSLSKKQIIHDIYVGKREKTQHDDD